MQYKQNNNSKSKKQNPFSLSVSFFSVCVSLSLSFSLFLSLSQESVFLTQQSIHTASNSKKGFAIWYDERSGRAFLSQIYPQYSFFIGAWTIPLFYHSLFNQECSPKSLWSLEHMSSFTHYSINVSPLEMGTKARFSETRQQDNMGKEKHGGSGPKASMCAGAPTPCSFMNWPQIYHTNKELFSELKIWLCIYNTRSATNTFCLPLKFTLCVSFIYSLKNILTTLHALEKEMATHSSVLAWRITGTGEPGGLPSLGSHKVGHDWSDLTAAACIRHYVRSDRDRDKKGKS